MCLHVSNSQIRSITKLRKRTTAAKKRLLIDIFVILCWDVENIFCSVFVLNEIGQIMKIEAGKETSGFIFWEGRNRLLILMKTSTQKICQQIYHHSDFTHCWHKFNKRPWIFRFFCELAETHKILMKIRNLLLLIILWESFIHEEIQ